jgi:RNA polymerase sigma-70 factor (ECF subfamily)
VIALSGRAPSDAALLASIAAGERCAFELFYRRYAAWLTVRLRYRCADDALVEDVVRETLLAIWRGSARCRHQRRGDVGGWWWRIGFRRLVDALRGQGALTRLARALARRRWRDESSAEEELLLRVEHGGLLGALAPPSPELRAVIQATVLDGAEHP